MGQRSQHTAAVVLLIALPIIAIFVVYMILRPRAAPTIPVPAISFLQTTGPPIAFLGTPQSPAQIGQPAGTPVRVTGAFHNIVSLVDGRIMLVSYPECIYFDLDGTETGRLELQAPANDLLEQEGLDPSEFRWLHREDSITEITATESGRVYGLFQSAKLEGNPNPPSLLVEWDSEGNPVSVIHITPLFAQYEYLCSFGIFAWTVSSDGERVIVGNRGGPYLLIQPDLPPMVTYSEYFSPQWENWWLVLSGEFVFEASLLPSRPVRHRLNGSIDWRWLELTSPYMQPSALDPQSGPLWNRWFGLLPDGGTILPVLNGVVELDREGAFDVLHRDATVSATLRSLMDQHLTGTFRCIEQPEGWLLLPSYIANPDNLIITGVRADADFNLIETIEFSRLASSPPATGVPAIAQPTPHPAQLLEIGDIADPGLAERDFHPIPDGYRVIDLTRRRVLTTDKNLTITAILDRTTIQNGLTQDIDSCRVDSRGVIYMLDQGRELIQVLDPNGDYLRRHAELGVDIFGAPLVPRDILLDRFVRLWILNEDRIYVIDREGNLARIFERPGAPYTRVPQGASPDDSPERTPRGYTIAASTDPFSRTTPTSPVTLDVSEISNVALGHGNASHLFYIADNQSDQVVIFDWNGAELGSIELSEFLTQDDYRFMTGPDGYCYLLDPITRILTVFDPLGEQVSEIELIDLPVSGWNEISLSQSALYRNSNRCWIDSNGRLVVFTQQSRDLLVYSLREDDQLEEDFGLPGPEESFEWSAGDNR